MKFVAILALIFIVAQIEAKPFRFKRSLKEVESESCVKELNLDEDEIYEISNRDYAPEDHQNYVTFMKCYWKKKGYLHQNGDINYDALRQMIVEIFEEGFSSEYSRNIADYVIGKCNNIQGTSSGQKAIKMENCVLRGLRELVEED